MNLLNDGLLATYAQRLALASALVISATAASAVTITIDDTTSATYPTLSSAVTAAYASDLDGDDIINIALNALPIPDGQVVLDKPITINGDAESGGVGDGTKCDILVDMAGMKNTTVPPVGDSLKAYLRLAASGDITITNLKIHPNADGASATDVSIVSGVRFLKPTTGISNYNLTGVQISGSKGAANTFLPLDTAFDLYTTSSVKLWGGHSGGTDGNNSGYAVYQLADTGGAGTYNVTLDHCHGGLTKSSVVNIIASSGTHKILGGVYGHSNRDGIRISGGNVTIQGTATDRVRIVRTTNTSGSNSHCIEITGGTVPILEYTDIVGLTSANNIAVRGGTTTLINSCRAFGKAVAGTNQTFFNDTAAAVVTKIQNSTFVGTGAQPSPFNIGNTVVNPTTVENCIFTSLANTGTVNTGSAGAVTFNNCAVPNDGTLNETLAAIPTTGAGTFNTSVTLSPIYKKVLADYDWSDAQNGDGNADVLRPTNSAAYTGKATSGNLVGGAGGTAVPVTVSRFEIE